ncbi:hypothetical protein [Citrobacter enshiensis]|uniref:DUF7079 family protein n=1 Tax=Citrobacter enshiensis TaxID=2971264 RepID=UPI0023E7D1A2|nr:hypothetical protein [Citrobacter enshiensis]WET41665.1 hypothetical protein P2W74_05390 [Citrobacter enshiensis]
MHLSEAELITRAPVWYALSELFTWRELQDYDYRWMAHVLKDSGLSREEIFTILDEEVAPALQTNLLFNPTPVIDEWSEDDIKELVSRYVSRKPTMIERVIPSRFLFKQRRKYIQDEILKLTAELDKGT